MSIPGVNGRKLVRVSNVSYNATSIYKVLSEVEGLDYQEHLAPESARLLREGQVDAALIPVTEFANHGGYVGLDFGLSCYEQTGNLLLCSNAKPQHLESIFLYGGAGASMVLLQLLLRERWRRSPKLIRINETSEIGRLGESQGMLLLDVPASDLIEFAYKEDIVKVWHQITGKPFVFLIWALRPESLSAKQLKTLVGALHRSVTIYDASPDQEGHRYSYYLDSNAIEGLDSFFLRAAHYQLMPLSKYKSATRPLIGSGRPEAVNQRSVSEILDSVVSGQRLGMSEAVTLLESASLGDLGLVAESLRQKATCDRTLSRLLFLDIHRESNQQSLDQEISAACDEGVKHLLLLPTTLAGLEYYEKLLVHIRQRFPVFVEAFTIPQLYQLAKENSLDVQAVISRLIAVGLNSVTPFGSGMLTDVGLKRRNSSLTYIQWVEAIRWILRCGASMNCCLSLSPKEAWVERISHLHVLRSIQDENPGFRGLFIEYSADFKVHKRDIEGRLRAIMIARIFLENVPSIQEHSDVQESLGNMLSICMGANEVTMLLGQNSFAKSEETIRILNSLGIQLNLRDVEADVGGEVH